MTLSEEIDSARQTIATDGYSISVGELRNLYKDDELDIHPEFQRLFRWSQIQKSRFIESLLLGIPIPSIFVAQRPDGVWDVVDGLQRLSTIFELTGDLRDDKGDPLPPLVLSGTKYLPSLRGLQWGNESDDTPQPSALTPEQRLFIKRSKLDVKILLRESDSSSQYELFQRLNTGGSHLSDQELRNCVLITVDLEFYRWLDDLSKFEPFQEAISLTENALSQQYDVELALRFLTLLRASQEELSGIGDLGEYLTEASVKLAQQEEYDRDYEREVFQETFGLLTATLGEDSFRRYDQNKQRFSGPFSISLYEIIAIGIGHNLKEWTSSDDRDAKLLEIIKGIGGLEGFAKSTGAGVRASSRVPWTVRQGRELFGREN